MGNESENTDGKRVFIVSLILGIIPPVIDIIRGAAFGHEIDIKEDIAVGLLIALSVFIIDIWQRIGHMKESIALASPKFFRNMPDFTPHLDMLGSQIIEVTKAAFMIGNQENEQIKQFSESQVARFANIMSDLKEGKIRILVANENIDRMIAAQMCRRSYKAVSTADLDKFWNSPMGMRMLEANRRAIAGNNISIERIFVYPTSFLRKLIPIMERHQVSGIRVSFLPTDFVTPELSKLDFGIVDDGKVIVEVSLQADNLGQDTTFYFSGAKFNKIRQGEINGVMNRWEEISNHGQLKSLDAAREMLGS